MPVQIGQHDDFEQRYKSVFNAMAARRGILIGYAEDRAAIDTAIHLTESSEGGGRFVTQTRVWFQLKGIEQGTQVDEATAGHDYVPVAGILVEHVRHWYQAPEAVYLGVYVESEDAFYADDVRQIVDSTWGDAILNPEFFGVQKTITLRIPRVRRVDDAFWETLRAHRSMRTDGVVYRGVPLPHRRDLNTDHPMRMEPALFTDVVRAVLSHHEYQMSEELDPLPIYPDAATAGDVVSLSTGTLFSTYEIMPQLTAEFVPDENGFRSDGQVIRVQGRCAVLIHSSVKSRPDREALKALAGGLVARGIDRLLVFVNHYMIDGFAGESFNLFPEFGPGLGKTGIACIPQHLEDIGRNIMTSPVIYLELRGLLVWISDYCRRKIESGAWRILEM